MIVNAFLHLLSFVALLVLAAWFGREGGYEPVATSVVALCSLIVTGRNFLKSFCEKQSRGCGKISRAEFAALASKTLLAMPGFFFSGRSLDDVVSFAKIEERESAIAIVYLFCDLGLLRLEANGYVFPVSEKADVVIKSFGRSLATGIPVWGDWGAEGPKNPEAEKLLSLVKSLEEFRCKKQGKEALAVREVEASIILIKSKMKKKDVFLMQHSAAWGGDGYFWFVGGIKEQEDSTIEECAYRELSEELSVEPSMVTGLHKLTTVSDKRISSRVGGLTSYTYTVFCLSLDPTNERVQKLHEHQFFHTRAVAWATKDQENKWLTWDELHGSTDLNRDAEEILNAIRKYGVDKIPYASALTVKAL